MKAQEFKKGLTEKENIVLEFICLSLEDWRDDEPDYIFIDGNDITKKFKWNPKVTSGVVGSLCKKGLLDSGEDDYEGILYPIWDKIPDEYGRIQIINKAMKTQKLKSELYTIEEFIEYWKPAGKRELKQALKNLKYPIGTAQKNEKAAIEALLV